GRCFFSSRRRHTSLSRDWSSDVSSSDLIRVLQATHPEQEEATEKVRRFVRTGASPRGAQAMLLASKIRALLDGRFAPSVDDVRASSVPALRHRILLNFEGEAEGINTDAVIDEILDRIPESKA